MPPKRSMGMRPGSGRNPKTVPHLVAAGGGVLYENVEETVTAKEMFTSKNNNKRGFTDSNENIPLCNGNDKNNQMNFNVVGDGEGSLNFDFASSKTNNHFATISRANSILQCYDKSKNIFHLLANLAIGRLSLNKKQEVQGSQITSELNHFEIVNDASSFKSRVTTIDWHPRCHNQIIIGSKHGDIVFYNIDDSCNNFEETANIKGLGPGGSISALKFHPCDNEKLFTSSLCGKVVQWNTITGKEELTLMNTKTWDNWFTSLDVHKHEDLVVSGRSTGWVYLQNRQGEKVWDKKLHKGKVTHAEFSPHDPSILCTASIDHTVKIWDMRMIQSDTSKSKGYPKPLACLNHEKGVNSAYFSLTDGCRLLTTDQGSNLHVYRAPYWHLETEISHPHRVFQHITPIKAYWHPCEDLIVCGRFPDLPKFPELGPRRTVDILDAGSGRLVTELKDIRYDKIVSLSKFNHTGEKLLTTMSSGVQMWSSRRLTAEDKMSEKERDQLEERYGGLWSSASGTDNGLTHSETNKKEMRVDRKKKAKDNDDIDTIKKKARAQTSTKRKTNNLKKDGEEENDILKLKQKAKSKMCSAKKKDEEEKKKRKK